MQVEKAGDLTHTLVAGLKDMILRGELRPGGKLPPERKLALRFHVNRASMRQALKALELMGVVHQRVGDGTYLTHDASTTLSAPLDFMILVDGITLQELYEARRIVEPELAARAAARRTAKDLADLESAVAAMKNEPGANNANDVRFHEIVWRAAGSRVCQRMFSSLSGALSRSSPRGAAAPQSYERILLAIKAGNAGDARRQMLEHLIDGESTALEAKLRIPPLRNGSTDMRASVV